MNLAKIKNVQIWPNLDLVVHKTINLIDNLFFHDEIIFFFFHPCKDVIVNHLFHPLGTVNKLDKCKKSRLLRLIDTVS